MDSIEATRTFLNQLEGNALFFFNKMRAQAKPTLTSATEKYKIVSYVLHKASPDGLKQALVCQQSLPKAIGPATARKK